MLPLDAEATEVLYFSLCQMLGVGFVGTSVRASFDTPLGEVTLVQCALRLHQSQTLIPQRSVAESNTVMTIVLISPTDTKQTHPSRVNSSIT